MVSGGPAGEGIVRDPAHDVKGVFDRAYWRLFKVAVSVYTTKPRTALLALMRWPDLRVTVER